MLWFAGAALFLAAACWAGWRFGLRTARRNPGFAAALLMFSAFFKVDPPPPPKVERIADDESREPKD